MDDLRRRLTEIIALQQTVLAHHLETIKKVAILVSDTLSAGHTVYLVGEGPNVLTTQHIAALFLGKHDIDRKALPVIAFTADHSLLALVGNDYGVGEVLSRQVSAFVQSGDAVVAFSTGGTEQTVLDALDQARAKGAKTVGLSGLPGDGWAGRTDLALVIPTKDYQRVHECLTVIGHLAYSHVEHLLFVEDRAATTKSLIRFACPSCGEKIYSEERFMGRKGTCPSCHAQITVPQMRAERVNVASLGDRPAGEKRMHMRFGVQDCTVAFSLTSFFDAGEAQSTSYPLENLSQGGLAFLMPNVPANETSLATGNDLFLSVDVPAFIEPMNVKGKVRRFEPLKDGASIYVGVEFVDCREVDREKLRKLTENVVLRNIRRSQGLF